MKNKKMKNKKMKNNKIIPFVPAIICMYIIFWFSAIRNEMILRRKEACALEENYE